MSRRRSRLPQRQGRGFNPRLLSAPVVYYDPGPSIQPIARKKLTRLTPVPSGLALWFGLRVSAKFWIWGLSWGLEIGDHLDCQRRTEPAFDGDGDAGHGGHGGAARGNKLRLQHQAGAEAARARHLLAARKFVVQAPGTRSSQ